MRPGVQPGNESVEPVDRVERDEDGTEDDEPAREIPLPRSHVLDLTLLANDPFPLVVSPLSAPAASADGSNFKPSACEATHYEFE